MIKNNFINQYLRQTQDLYGDKLYLKINKQTNIANSLENALVDFNHSINTCQKCQLGNSRTNFVFGVGDKNADLLLVGEAPGEKEDLEGIPFVGRAGKLLDKILSAISLSRDKGVYICNVLKCRPPDNRDPLPSEIEQCEPYLKEQINLIKPKLIVALGRVAAKTLLKNDLALKDMRSIKHDYYGTPLIATYHPAALLRNQNLKPAAWEDFKWIRSLIN
ncbi:uracil-DNA glycosylase [Candidatus Marinimicrobia bacterium]|nr:uracil-DNA glycosylase [Candidatus Neomarinimicrobiota bacterium]